MPMPSSAAIMASDSPRIVSTATREGRTEAWKVQSDAVPIMGSVEDKSRPPAGEPTGVLILRGMVIMGGVEIKS